MSDSEAGGLGPHRSHILQLVLVNAFVGAMVGIERTVLPLIAEADFGIASTTAAVSFIATFGVTKAAVNFFAGALSDRWGRRMLLIVGWLVGLPVPILLILAPSWAWILAANVLLGVNQALTWSMTVVMKVDLAGPRHYGLVIGWNEFAGYAGVAAAAAATGFIASVYGLRPEPFYLGLGIAAVGLLLSLFAADTRADSATRGDTVPNPGPTRVASQRADRGMSLVDVWKLGTYHDADLSAASLAGLSTNLKDGALWGLLPLLLAARSVPIEIVGSVVALYPAVWAVSQLYFGPLSDRVGRKALITGGVILQGVGVAGFVLGNASWAYYAAATVAGVGTGMVYPTLLALVSDVAAPAWRASALGVYRLWRDSGYAVGALASGVVADAAGLEGAMWAVAGFSVLVGVVFGTRTRGPSGPG